jgi:hypothetical protein
MSEIVEVMTKAVINAGYNPVTAKAIVRIAFSAADAAGFAIVLKDDGAKVREECAKAVEAEGLEEAPDNDADRAYDSAIEHAAAAIRELGSN